MKFSLATVAFVASLSLSQNCDAFTSPLTSNNLLGVSVSSSSSSNSRLQVASADPETEATTTDSSTTQQMYQWNEIRNMPYRQLQKNLKTRELEPIGTTAVLRERLHMACGGECVIDEGASIGNCDGDEQVAQLKAKGIEFTDVSDQDFEFNDLIKEILAKAEVNHWKAATRKLKKLKKNFATPDRPIPENVYVTTLKACMADRLNGARASEPARKIMEDMVSNGYSIPSDMLNYCIMNSLGDGPDGTHDQCGGIDCALAMMAAGESSANEDVQITEETYGRVATVLSNSGEIDDAIAMLRSMIVDRSYTPTLGVFADIGVSAAKFDAEKVMSVLALAKAAGYELDNISSTVDGRSLIAAGVVAAEKINNVALGLRLLTAASKARGCEPDRGDNMVASSSSAAQRASTLIHKRAINKAVEDSNWKLSVRLMELMLERSLKPSVAVWKNVVTCCAKNEKSKKATALLLDWVKLYEDGKLDKPPIRVFNTVVNVCEICEEQSLTLLALESMKKTHQTDGTIITFNIALKRLAKQGDVAACEGIIIGMLQQGVEPTVVSYTTAIASCAANKENKNPTVAYEWIKRMRSRNVMPNVITYNTALAACIDGKLESTMLGSKIASEMMADVDKQLEEGIKGNSFTTVTPDVYTKTLGRQLMKQLRENWRSDDIDMRVAKSTLRPPLLNLVDFSNTDRAEKATKQAAEVRQEIVKECEDEIEKTDLDETELEYAAAAIAHRTAEV